MARYVRFMRQLRPQIVHGWLHYPNLIARIARPLCPPHRLITAIRSEYTVNQLRSEHFTAWLSDFRIVIKGGQDHGKRDSHTKTVMIPNGLAFDLFQDSTGPKLRETLFPNTLFLILVPARIDPRKDHRTLIEAIHKLPPSLNIKIVLIGEITDFNTQQQIRQSIQDYRLETIIQQLPPTRDIAPFYHAADSVLLPSKSEAFSNVILETFASRKPIIVSEAANPDGIVQHGVNGWVFPTGDSTALAGCLQMALASSEAERRAFGQKGYEAVQVYTIERMVERYTQLYERALDKEA